MKAALYGRYSTDKQSEASIDDQMRVCERIAEREGFEVVARFSDAAVSGGTSRRSGYQRMLAAARRHEFEAIVAEDSSRLWRELSEQWRALKELRDLGVHVIGHGLDTRRDESKILLAVSGAMAEAYRDEIARRTHRGLEGRARAGKPTGGKAYGYIAARDSASGQVEVNAVEAEVVRRIFMLYADGASPRTIAATLNAEGVPSPGATWKRTHRRTSGWLASALHGHVTRGTGILNNCRYIGIVTWGRSHWQRGAADSSKRRMRMLEKPAHEAHEERLRIVPQSLWERAKARQACSSATLGATVRGGLRKRSGGAGRPGKYLLSGLLACGVCGASFVLRNREHYCCASHWNGRACPNSMNVSRKVAEAVLLEGIRDDLRDPRVIAEVERRVRAALKQRRAPKANHGRRIAELTSEVQNLVNAIAGGMLKASPALAARLAATEAELARLQAEQQAKPAVSLIVPDIGKRFLGLVDRLDEVLVAEPERGREELRGLLGERIRLAPDQSGGFLWAEYSLGITPLFPAAGANADLMVAGAGFEPATFGL